MPIGAMLAVEHVAASLTAGSHGTTFGGNPLSCAVAISILDVIEQEHILENVKARSAQFSTGLQKLVNKYDLLLDVRGHGLLLGMLCDGEVAPLIQACRENGLLVLGAGPHVLRLLPPLNVTAEEIDEALALLKQSLEGLK